MTRMRPSENPMPERNRVGPKPNSDPVPMMVERTPPRAMNAPATTPSTNVVTAGARAFATPRVSTSSAISRGEKVSMPDMGWGLSPTALAPFMVCLLCALAIDDG
jgi:hypothetical protein